MFSCSLSPWTGKIRTQVANILKVSPCSFQVWNQTEQEPVAYHFLSLCFLRTAGSWVPPMYLWVLGPIYLFYILRHGQCYLRMSHLFKIKMVAMGSLNQGVGRVAGSGAD